MRSALRTLRVFDIEKSSTRLTFDENQYVEIARDAEMVRFVGFNVSPPRPSGMVTARGGNHKGKRGHLSLMKHIYDNERGFEILSFREHPGSCRGSAARKHYITTHPRFFFPPLSSLFEQVRLFVSAIEDDVLTSKLGSSESSRFSLVTLKRHYSAGARPSLSALSKLMRASCHQRRADYSPP